MAVSVKKLDFKRFQKQVMRESSEHTSERAQQANHRNELELAEQTQLSRWREIRQTSKYPSKYSKAKKIEQSHRKPPKTKAKQSS